MKNYVLCTRKGIHIIDLNKTLGNLSAYLEVVKKTIASGGNVLFVGTKKQIKDCIREEAQRCDMPYVCERWLGGMLTNFNTVKNSIKKLEDIERMEEDGTFEMLPKKEALSLSRKKNKLQLVLTGIRYLKTVPSLLFVVDIVNEHIAVAEGNKLSIPIGAIVDTNTDPAAVDYPIPANDDGYKSVSTIVHAIADTILEAKGALSEQQMQQQQQAAQQSAQEESAAGSSHEEAPAHTPEPAPADQTASAQTEESASEEPKRKKRVVRRKMEENS
jgi:small subunit ribosomal protein S2